MTINSLIKIYCDKGFIESADVELSNPIHSEDKIDWLKRFIEVWERMEEKDRQTYLRNKGEK